MLNGSRPRHSEYQLCRHENATAQQCVAGTAIHLPLQRLQAIDLTLDGAGRPSMLDRAADGLDVAANSGSQRGQFAVPGLSDPSLQQGGIITPQYCC